MRLIRERKLENNRKKGRWRGKSLYSLSFIESKLGYKKNQLSQWELGERKIPILDFYRLLKFYNADILIVLEKVVSKMETKCDK